MPGFNEGHQGAIQIELLMSGSTSVLREIFNDGMHTVSGGAEAPSPLAPQVEYLREEVDFARGYVTSVSSI